MPADVTRGRPEVLTTETDPELFVGRRSSVQALKSWLTEHDSGVLAVTGAAGTGKSALLRQLSPSAPHLQLVDVARTVTAWIDARDLVLAELHRHLIAAVGADLRDRHVVTAAIGELHPTAVIDGLDEMTPGETLATAVLLRDLAECGFRIVVALRTDPETPPESGENPCGVLEPDAQIQLDSAALSEENHQDVAELVGKILIMSGSPLSPGEAARTARSVSYRAGGNFLLATIIARGMAGRYQPDTSPLAGVTAVSQAIDFDLDRLADGIRSRVTRMLCALSWAVGPGVPTSLWAAMATQLAKVDCDERDLELTMTHAGWYVSRSGPKSDPHYRLRHSQLVEHFRSLSCSYFPIGDPDE